MAVSPSALMVRIPLVFVLNGNPAFFGLHWLAVGGKVGAFLLTVEDRIEEGFVLSAADDDSTAGTKGNLGGGEFTNHSADRGCLVIPSAIASISGVIFCTSGRTSPLPCLSIRPGILESMKS